MAKRIVSLFTVLVLCIVFISCASEKTDITTSPEKTSAPEAMIGPEVTSAQTTAAIPQFTGSGVIKDTNSTTGIFIFAPVERETWNIEIEILDIKYLDDELGKGVDVYIKATDNDKLGFYWFPWDFMLEYYNDDGEWETFIYPRTLGQISDIEVFFNPEKGENGEASSYCHNIFYRSGDRLPIGRYRLSKIINGSHKISVEFDIDKQI